ncbi:hypothetical protein [Mycobacterium asiaticum]|uniref:Uncharacterized protein n=1 Tax=Mycobacterium asiaticum TaxID=1790 RepID=A0A1A3C1K9_MYCAS|nr:hypothetical protein [Mycobacterium asiaticum]OBI79601.1 hypothetical protein A9X01_02370 [Mycobacterium asiaticum]
MVATNTGVALGDTDGTRDKGPALEGQQAADFTMTARVVTAQWTALFTLGEGQDGTVKQA